MDSKSYAIGILSITAIILLVGLFVIHAAPQPATAGEVSSYGGDFTLTVGRLTQDTEVLYVIDNTTQRMILYGINRKTGKINIGDSTELNQALIGGRQRMSP